MHTQNPRSSLAFKFMAVVVMAAAGAVVFLQSPLRNLLTDPRFDGLAVGDFVKVRRSSDGVRLDIYAAKPAPSRDYEPDFREFLQTLPKLSGIHGTELELSTDETISSRDISQINLLDSVKVTWSIEVAAAVTLEEVEFERFGEIDLAIYAPVVSSVMAADQPVTATFLNSARGMTQTDYWKGYRRFRSTVIENYRNTTSDPEAVQDACTQFLTAAIAGAANQSDAPKPAEIYQLATNALEVSTDPLVHVYAVRQVKQSGDEQQAARLLSAALDRLNVARAPVTAFIGRLLQVTKDGIQRDRTGYKSDADVVGEFVQCSDALQELIGQHPEHLRFAMHLYRVAWDHLDDNSRQRLLQSLLMNPASDLWLTHTLLSTWHNDLGWRDRSYTMYHEVRPELRESFSKELHIAAWHALAAHSLRPDIPDSASLLNNIARTGEVSIGTPRAWFIQGIQYQLDFMPFYEDYLLSLYPKWGGRHSQILDFARACAACTRLDTEVPYFALTCLEKLQQDIGRKENTWKRPDVRSIAQDFRRTLSTSTIAEPVTKQRIQDSLNRCAAMALLADDFVEARAALEAADPADSPWFEHYELDRAAVLRRQVFARTGLAESQVMELEQQMSGGYRIDNPDTDFDALLNLIEEIRTADEHQWQQEYCDQRETAIRKFREFFEGKPVSLPFDETQFIWRLRGGLSFSEDSSFVITPDMSRSESVFADLRLQFPQPFRLTVRFSLGSQDSDRSAAGVSFIDAESMPEKTPSPGDYIFANNQHAGIWHMSQRGIHRLTETELPQDSVLEISVYRDHYAVRLNGSALPDIQRDPPATATIARVGSEQLSNYATDVTFNEVVIQKLDPASEEQQSAE